MIRERGDDWTINRLLRHDRPAVQFNCAKWRIDPHSYRAGDVPPRPRTLVELSDALGKPMEDVRRLDRDFIRSMTSNETLQSERLAFFRWPVENARQRWEREYGGTYDEFGRLKRKLF